MYLLQYIKAAVRAFCGFLDNFFLSLSPDKFNNFKLWDDYCCGCLATGMSDLDIWNLRLQTHLSFHTYILEKSKFVLGIDVF